MCRLVTDDCAGWSLPTECSSVANRWHRDASWAQPSWSVESGCVDTEVSAARVDAMLCGAALMLSGVWLLKRKLLLKPPCWLSSCRMAVLSRGPHMQPLDSAAFADTSPGPLTAITCLQPGRKGGCLCMIVLCSVLCCNMLGQSHMRRLTSVTTSQQQDQAKALMELSHWLQPPTEQLLCNFTTVATHNSNTHHKPPTGAADAAGDSKLGRGWVGVATPFMRHEAMTCPLVTQAQQGAARCRWCHPCW